MVLKVISQYVAASTSALNYIIFILGDNLISHVDHENHSYDLKNLMFVPCSDLMEDAPGDRQELNSSLDLNIIHDSSPACIGLPEKNVPLIGGISSKCINIKFCWSSG